MKQLYQSISCKNNDKIRKNSISLLSSKHDDYEKNLLF